MQFALSSTIPVGSGEINSSSLTNGDIVSFTANGSLLIDNAINLNSINSEINGNGVIKFSTNNNLIVDNSIGTSTKSLNNILYNVDATLTAKSDLYLINGITTVTNSTGKIELTNSTPATQKISSSIGSANFNLNEILINQDSGAEFTKDVYSTNFKNKGVSAKISGAGNLNFTNASFEDNTIISSSGAVNIGTTSLENGITKNFGTTSIINGKTLNIANTSTSLTNLTMNDSSKIIITDGKSLNLLGNISGSTGLINALAIAKAGDPVNTATLSLSGKITQTVQASLGDASTRLTNLNISNVVSSQGPSISTGVILENNAFVNNINFTNNLDTSKILIVTGKNINLSRNISEISGGKGILTGDGKLTLESTSAQTIDANLGTSTTDRLNELEIKNTYKITLNDDSYIKTLTSSSNSSLSNNLTLNIETLNADQDILIGGYGALEVATLNIASAKNLTLDANKTIKITGSTTGAGAIKTNSSGTGNIFFSSSADINVASKIGESTARLNKMIVNTADNIVNLSDNTFVSGVDFTNSAGQSKLSIATGKTLDVSGDISNTSDSLINGLGKLKLSGNVEQNIYAKIGNQANPLGTLEINNPLGATLYQDSFVNALTLTNGAIKIAGKTLTINGNLDLSGQSFASKMLGDFGKIITTNLTISNTTNINIDYANNNIDLDYSASPIFNTKYSIIESANPITGDASLVKVTDNSYLFDNALQIEGNKLLTSIKPSANFSQANIGVENYQLLENALSYSNLSSKFFRISSKENLNFALMSLKPMSVDAFINNALSVNENIFNAISAHLQNTNLTNEIDSKNKDNIHKNYGLWGQLFGDKSVQKNTHDQQKFNTNSYGGIIGAEHLIKNDNNNILIGSAIAINKSKITDDLKIHNNAVDSYQINLYNNNYAKVDEGFYSKNFANFSINKYKNLRNIKIENYLETAKSNFNGKSYSFESGIGYKNKILENFSITPDFSIKYFKFSQDSYKESGLGSAVLSVKGADYNEFITKLGIDFSGNFSYSAVKYQPNFTISWDRKLKNNRQIMQSNFSNGLENSKSSLVVLQRDKLNLGFGLILSENNHQKLNLRYNLQLAKHFINNGGFAEYSWEF